MCPRHFAHFKAFISKIESLTYAYAPNETWKLLKDTTYLTQFAKLNVCFQFPKSYVRLEARRKGKLNLIASTAVVPSVWLHPAFIS